MKKKLFTLMTLLLCLCSTAWAETTIWESNMQESITGVAQTKGRSNDTWATNSSLSWASSDTYPSRFNCGGSSSALTLEFDTPLSLHANYAIRVYWGSTKDPNNRTLSLTLNTDASPVASQVNLKNTVRVLDYELSGDVTLDKFKVAVTGDNCYIFKVSIVNLEGPSTGETTVSFGFIKGTNIAEGITNNRIKTLSSYSTSIAASNLTIGTNNSIEGYCGQITGQQASYSESYYVDLQYTVADGYTFTPSSTSFKFRSNNANMKAKVSILDGMTTVTSNESSGSANSDITVTFADGAFTGKAFTGTVHLRVYLYGVASQRAYLTSPFTITGTVASAAPASKYDVTYHANGSGEEDVEHNVSTVENNMFTWAGHSFTGWNTAADGSGDPYAVGASVTGDLELYAQWEAATYTVTVVKNNNDYGTVTSASVADVAYNTTITATDNVLSVGTTDITATAADATVEYTYRFSNWTGIPDGGKVTDNVTITANFTRTPVNYTLAWNTNGGSDLAGNPTSGSVAYGTTITKPTDPTRDGYTFIGWAETANGAPVSITTMPAKDVTYYAQWSNVSIAFVFKCETDKANLDLSSATPTGTSAASLTPKTTVTATAGLSDTGKSSAPVRTCKIAAPNGKDASKYVQFEFTVESGKQLNVKGLDFKVLTVGSSNYAKQSYEAVLSDNAGHTYTGTCGGFTNNELNGFNFNTLGVVSGEVSLKIYGWNTKAADTYRMQQTNTIYGVVEDLPYVSGTITDSGWNTFSSNQKLDLYNISGGTAYVASSIGVDRVVMKECTDIVEAGTGLMIKGTAGATFTINTTDAPKTFSGTNRMVGLPNGGTVAQGNYVFGWSDPDYPGFYYINETEPTLGAGKAYLSGGSNNARLSIVFDSETTGISNLNVNDSANFDADAPMYNLAGQRVTKAYKGVVIVNGKKVVRK